MTRSKQTISRREALKVLTAAGGGLALSTLPSKWKKPLIEVGLLPAFAQTSPTPTPDLGSPPVTSNCQLVGPIGSCDSGGGISGRIYLVTCNYTDVDGNMLPNEARVRVVARYPSGQTSAQEEALDPINITGDGFSGTVTVPFCINFGGQSEVALTISFLDANRLVSNTEQVTIIPASSSQKESTEQPGIVINP